MKFVSVMSWRYGKVARGTRTLNLPVTSNSLFCRTLDIFDEHNRKSCLQNWLFIKWNCIFTILKNVSFGSCRT